MTRNVTLVLVDLNGAVSGALPSFSVSTPWWQVVDEVVDKARALYGLELSVLRLLTTDRPREQGGEVSYAAELHSESSVEEDRTLRLRGGTHPEGLPLHVVPPDAARELGLATHPLRAAWARPGGPSCSIAWARGGRRLRWAPGLRHPAVDRGLGARGGHPDSRILVKPLAA